MDILKEFRNILSGQQIQVYTDYETLTYKTFHTERVMKWRFFLEEYNSELIYIRGSKNIAADALSRLDIVDTNNPIKPNMSSLAEHFSLEKEDGLQTLNYKTIM